MAWGSFVVAKLLEQIGVEPLYRNAGAALVEPGAEQHVGPLDLRSQHVSATFRATPFAQKKPLRRGRQVLSPAVPGSPGSWSLPVPWGPVPPGL